MQSCAKLLIVLLLWTSQASAWDPDNCQTDLVFDVVATAALNDHTHEKGQLGADVCGHCSHMGAHLLGYITAHDPSLPIAADDAIETLTPFRLYPVASPLFHPPRSSSV